MEQTTTDLAYEPPALVAVGDFSEDTLGIGYHWWDAVDWEGI